MTTTIRLFLVDDDTVFLKLLEVEFREHSYYDIKTYINGEQCVKNIGLKPDIIILDYLLNGVERNVMNGIETLDKIKAIDPDIPIIILSAQDKIEIAVDCMHHGAFDYVVKSETAFIRLQKIITTICDTRRLKKQLNWYMEWL